jgi:putative nucleotidyltransferase with HDIG domain
MVVELYAVGGCVRDLLLGRKVGDVDLAVVGDAGKLARIAADRLNAQPPAIYARFGTALLITGTKKIEFATARTESYSPNSRKPSEVIPCTIEEDLQRRDFTVNALAYGVTGRHQGKLLDLFSGLTDLKRRLLRTPLDPTATFSDDPLRMLRAVRFAAALDFTIDPETFKGIQENASRIKIVARERCGDEFLKMMAGPAPAKAAALMVDCGLMAQLIPEVTAMSGVDQVGRHAHKDVLIHSIRVMQNVAETSDDPIVRLAGLLHDIGKPRTKKFDPIVGWTFHGHESLGANMAHRIGQRLHLGKENVQRLVQLVRLHMRPVNLTDEGVTDSAIRRLMVEAGDGLEDQLILCRADITTANPKLVHRYLANFDEMEHRMHEVNSKDRMRQFQSPVRGEEIMEICGIEEGPLVGAIKGRIEDAILAGDIAYDYDAAREFLLRIKNEVMEMDIITLREEIRLRSMSRSRDAIEAVLPKGSEE